MNEDGKARLATKILAGAKMVPQGEGKLVGALSQAPGQSYETAFSKNLSIDEYNCVCDRHKVKAAMRLLADQLPADSGEAFLDSRSMEPCARSGSSGEGR